MAPDSMKMRWFLDDCYTYLGTTDVFGPMSWLQRGFHCLRFGTWQSVGHHDVQKEEQIKENQEQLILRFYSKDFSNHPFSCMRVKFTLQILFIHNSKIVHRKRQIKRYHPDISVPNHNSHKSSTKQTHD